MNPVGYRLSIGVDIFFVISGFLITSRLIAESKGDRVDLKSFYIRRVFRILPVALVYLAFLGMFHLLVSGTELLSCLTFWRNVALVSEPSYTGHFWSLSVEEQFYLAWPIGLRLMGLRRAKFCAVAGLMAIVAMKVIALVHPQWFPRGPGHYDGLLCGCIAAIAFPSITVRSRILFWTNLAVGFGLYDLAPFLSICLMTAVVSTVRNPDWSVSRFLEWRPLELIGQRSYGIYIWHLVFLYLWLPGDPSLWIIPRLLVTTVFVELSYRFVELPLQRFGKGIAGGALYENRALPKP